MVCGEVLSLPPTRTMDNGVHIVRCGVAGVGQAEDEGAGEVVITRSRYVVAELPLRLQALRVPQDKPNPRLGVGERSRPARRQPAG